ncbi:putative quinol monooxygenase [Paenibacillus sp. KS-LC4]|uniref:putative quinol monooxygenase n=1 Tax=Paenibacillus sp. KS-LC4 TaxID=2979727 RepID=UPI0030CA97D8
MIIVQAFLKVQAEAREAFIEKAKVAIAATQQEPGNISYKLYEDAEQTSHFVLLEEWRDQQAIDEHNETAHYKAFALYTRGVLAAPPELKVSTPKQ